MAANLNPHLWFETPTYSNKLKAQAVEWHKGHRLIALHSEDARMKKQNRKGKG